jgi:hypothetical protein
MVPVAPDQHDLVAAHLTALDVDQEAGAKGDKGRLCAAAARPAPARMPPARPVTATRASPDQRLGMAAPAK